MADSDNKFLLQQKTSTGMADMLMQSEASIVEYGESNVKEALDSLNTTVKDGVVTGVKGNAETSYRKGNVNITPTNIGLGNVENKTMDTTPTTGSSNYVSSGGVAAQLKTINGLIEAQGTKIDDITAIAEGKTNTYVLKAADNSQFNMSKNTGVTQTTVLPSATLKLNDGTTIKGSDLKIGDIVLVIETDKYDWWVGQITSTAITCYVFEAEKVDLTAYATKTYVDTMPTTKEFTTLATSNKTLVTAINEVDADTNIALNGLTNAQQDISGIQTDIANIKNGTTAVGKADKLTTARTISLTGDVTGSLSFDGSANKSMTTTLKNSGIVAGTYSAVTFNAKGIATQGGNLIEIGETTSSTPSDLLAIGGLFFKRIA